MANNVGRNGLCKLSIDSRSLRYAVVDFVLLGESNDSQTIILGIV